MNNQIAFYRKEPGFRSAADRAAMITFFEKARAIYEKLANVGPAPSPAAGTEAGN